MLIDFCTFNIRGLKNKQSFFKDFLVLHKFSFCSILETHVKQPSAAMISHFICPKFTWTYNYDFHPNGRIWVGWDPGVWKVVVISASAQQITCKVQHCDAPESFVVTFIYSFNTSVERRTLWHELLSTQAIIGGDTPWSISGDFNVCLGPHETNSAVNWTSCMLEFKDVITQLGVTDLSFTGDLFTWWDCNIGSPTFKKLDRCLVNGAWLSTFPEAQCKFLARGLSDHNPAAVCMGLTREKVKKPFVFFNYLINEKNFLDEVKLAWQYQVAGDPWYVLTMKLKKVKMAMRKLNFDKGNVHSLVSSARDALFHLQNNLPAIPSNAQLVEERLLIADFQKALRIEENFLKQKSRVQWLKSGDSNNRFFFNSCKSRWNINKITSLVDDAGIHYNSHRDISQHAVNYFTSLLGQPGDVANILDFVCLPQISDQQKENLVKPFSELDVLNTFKHMAKNKSPGPDGFTAEFFIAAWDVVGADVCKGVLYFFNSKKLPKIVNASAITLVPKKQPANHLSEYRPIACCNVLYKCISKMIALRLKHVIPDIISASQSAFVPQRLIGDNIFLAQALCSKYHLNSGQPRCAIKLDIRKAFDTLNWKFLLAVLQRIGFPSSFIDWIAICLNSCMISIKVNGSLEGFFNAKSGLRQGDPISPYLFVLAMEALSACLKVTTANENFRYHGCTKELDITHLIFADDLMLFSYGNQPSIDCIIQGVNLFSSISGLHPNKEKSLCFFANVLGEVQDAVLATTGFAKGALPIRYLGLPLISTQLSSRDCRPLIMRIRDKIELWTNKLLNHAGRLQLLKIVLFGIQSYWSVHLALPVSVLKELQSLFVKFLWGGSATNAKQVKVSWHECCLKKEEGGLGLRDLCHWSRVAFLYHIWRIIQPTNQSLWIQWFRCFVVKNKPFWSMTVPKQASWNVRKILIARPDAMRFVQYMVGDNSHHLFWHDPWCDGSILVNKFHHSIVSLSDSSPLAKAGDFIQQGAWSLPTSNHVLVIELRRIVASITIHTNDNILWDGLMAPNVSMASIWDSTRPQGSSHPWTVAVWHKFAIPKCSFTLWLALKNRLLTKERMVRFGMDTDTQCILCNNAVETNEHLFSLCPFINVIMGNAGFNFTRDWSNYLMGLFLSGPNSEMVKLVSFLFLGAAVFLVWKERNDRLHTPGHHKQPLDIRQLVFRMVREKLYTCKEFKKAVKKNPNLMTLLY